MINKKKKPSKSRFISLPISRFKQFFFIYKTNPMLTIKLSLLLSIFVAPLIVQLILLLLFLGPTINSGKDTEIIIKDLFNLIRLFSLFFTITIPITSIGLSSIGYIFKRIIYNDGFILKRDMLIGLKDSKNSFIQSFVYSLFLVLLLFGLFMIDPINHLTLFIVLSILAVILLSIILISYFYSISLNTYYKTSIIENFKDSFILSFNSLFKLLLILILGFSPFLVLFFIDAVVFSRLTFLSLIGVIYLVFIGLGNTTLCFNLSAVYSFDKHINISRYPEIHNLGLYKGEDDD